MAPPVRLVSAIVVLTALFAALPGQAANRAWDAPAVTPVSLILIEARTTGTSFLDYAKTTFAEELSYSLPATFPGPLVAVPRREPDVRWMLLASLGLLAYLVRRRGKALGASS
jgi:hypothetical protein